MRVWHNRPLLTVCTALMGGAALGFALSEKAKLVAILLMLAVSAACTVIAVLGARGSGGVGGLRGWLFFPLRAKVAAVAAAVAAVALLQSLLVFQTGPRVALVSTLYGQEVTAVGVIADCRGSGGYSTSYTLKLTSLNGTSIHGNALLTCRYVSDLTPGQEVSLTVTAQTLREAAGEGYSATALIGDGYCLGLLSESEEGVTVTAEETLDLLVRSGGLRRGLSARLALLTGEAGGGIPSALLLGDKQYLRPEIKRDFARAGVSHLLAISGLHMTLLFGMIEGLLRLIRVPRKGRAVLLMALSAGYLLLLGFPPSATRAVIMLGTTYAAHLFSARTDALTSLGLAGSGILLLAPHTVADAGFWMSFLATFGLLTVMPLINGALALSKTAKGSLGARFVRAAARWLLKAVTGLAVGVVAMSFTLIPVAAVIGEMGILSPLTTLILTPFCALLLVGSPVALLTGGTGIGATVGGLVGQLSEVMADLASCFGAPSYAVVSLRHPAILPIAVCVTVATAVLLALSLPPRRRGAVLLPLLAGWLAIGAVLGGHALLTRNQLDVTYLQPSSRDDMLVMVAGNRGMICDLSDGSRTAMSAAVREMKARGGTEVAVLMLTHYHSRSVGTLYETLRREKVRELWLPSPADGEEYYLLLACLETAEGCGVPVTVYHTGQALRVFGGSTLTLETTALKRSARPVLLLSIAASAGSASGERLVLCGSAVFESDLADTAAEWVSGAAYVIFGNHGPLCKAPYGGGLSLDSAKALILSGEGDTAYYLDTDAIPEGLPLHMGQKRLTLSID